MKLLSSYFSDDKLRTALVFVKDARYIVECLDSMSHKDSKQEFVSSEEAEEFAEEWVL